MAKSRSAAQATRRGRRRVNRPPPGTHPGHLNLDPNAAPTKVRVLSYGPDAVQEADSVVPAEVAGYFGAGQVTWVDVTGLGSEAALRALGEQFGLHRLALEDVVNVYQRPKVDSFGDHFHVVLRQPRLNGHVDIEQVTIFAGPGWLLSFREQADGSFEQVRQRIRNPERPIRRRGSDYLAYALIDAILDTYFPIMEHLGDQLEALQEEIMARPRRELLRPVHETRHSLSTVRRATWPMREMLNAMIRDPLPGMTEETRTYLRDCYDHAILAMELAESYRDAGAELMDLYLSSVGNRTNEIVKVLTITGAVFIPITFVASVYGMNFTSLPGLTMPHGYLMVALLMAGIAAAMLLFFWRKGWLD